MHRRPTWLAGGLAALFLPAAMALAANLDNRPATQEEIRSFNSFYQKLHPSGKPPTPVFSATRTGKDRKWTVTASVFEVTGRGYKQLCHGKEDNFVYMGAAGKGAEWKEGYQQVQYVWIDRSASCAVPTQRIEMTSPLPDVDVLEVLENANQVLKKYASFIRGFSCRRLGAMSLRLASLGTGTDSNGEVMVKLGYRNDSNDTGELLVRKIGKDFTPWDFRCAAP